MCIKAVDWAFRQSIRPTAKLVLVALAHFRNHKTYQCNPSIAALVRLTGLGRSTVCRELRYLREQNLIVAGLVGSHKTNSYIFPRLLDGPGEGLGVPERDGGSPTVGPYVVPERDPNQGNLTVKEEIQKVQARIEAHVRASQDGKDGAE